MTNKRDARDPKYLHSAARNRLHPEAAPRMMTGLWGSLTETQRKAAIAYDGPITLGTSAWSRRRTPSHTTE